MPFNSKEKYNNYQRSYQRKNGHKFQKSPKGIGYNKKYKASPERKKAIRQNDLKRKYGIGLEEYSKRVIDQNGRCAICLEPPADKVLCVDHNHTTNTVRGLLCRNCNLILGHAKDSILLLQSAMLYLEKDGGV